MAGLETVVRPVVFPNIRPAPAQLRAPANDPEKGFATIKGQGGKVIEVTNSFSSSASSQVHKETQRRVDKARVFQQDDNKQVNKEVFVDVEVPNKMWMKGPPSLGGPSFSAPGFSGPAMTPAPNIQTWSLQHVREAKNIEIKERDKMVYGEE